MVVETVRILITAESDMNSSDKYFGLFETLVGVSCFTEPWEDLLDKFSYASASATRLSLSVELMKLFVIHGAAKVQSEDYPNHYWMSDMLIDTERLVKKMSTIFECFDPFNSMMDSIGQMVCCFLFSGVDENLYWYANHTYKHAIYFMNSFITIAGYSSQPGRSKRLIRLLLDDLKASDIKDPRSLLLKELKKETDASIQMNYIRLQRMH